jgi:putative photosynthetic complex assembly protein
MTAHSFPHRPEQAPDQHHDQILIPKPILYAMIALVAFTIVSVALGRIFQVGVTREGTLHPRQSVTFTVSGSEGGPLIVQRSDGLAVPLAKAGEEIFPRLILRSVANIRMREGIALSTPLKIDLMADGEHLLVDPATHRVMRLDAFGPENGRFLDRLLTQGNPA